MHQVRASSSCPGSVWKRLGPGGGGAQYIPTVSPHDPRTVLLACDMTGTYLTHDGGESWMQLNFHCRVLSIAFDPTVKGCVYVGGTGLYRSEDNGLSWQLVFPDPQAVTSVVTAGDHADHRYVSGDNWPGGLIQAIAVDPADPDSLFAGIMTGKGPAVFGSTDRGNRWTEIGSIAGSAVKALVINPSSAKACRRLLVITDKAVMQMDASCANAESISLPGSVETVIQAASGAIPGRAAPVVYLTSPSYWEGSVFRTGVYASYDFGRTFRQLYSGLDDGLAVGEARVFTSVAACQSNGDVVYLSILEPMAATGMSTRHFGILKSLDAGQSWHWVLKIDSAYPANKELGWIERNYRTDWAGAPIHLGVSPTDPGLCYATDWGTTYRTADGGDTWQQVYCTFRPDGATVTRGIDVTNVYGIHFDPFDRDHIVLSCTDVGLFQSQDGGRGWQHAQAGIPDEWVNTCYWLVFDPEVRGKAWSIWSGCHDMPRPKMFIRDDFTEAGGGVCVTSDGMDSWRLTSAGLPQNCLPTYIVLNPCSPAARRTLYVAAMGGGVYKSTDGGQSWCEKNNGIGGNRNAWKLVLLPDGTLYLLVARGLADGKVVDGALYKSTDGAECWTRIELPTGVNFPNNLCAVPEAPGRLYLACWPTDGGRGGGAYLSEDGGGRWQPVYPESAHVYGVAVPPCKPSSVVITTFEGTVMRSDDKGRTWLKLPGYDFKWAKEPIFDPNHEGMLFITTFGGSVWHGPDGGALFCGCEERNGI